MQEVVTAEALRLGDQIRANGEWSSVTRVAWVAANLISVWYRSGPTACGLLCSPSTTFTRLLA